MMTRGEVALIVAQKGLDVGVVDPVYFTAVILLKNRSADPARMFVNRRLDGQATVLPDRSEERPIADGPAEADCPAKASAEGAAEPADGGDNG